MRASLLHLAAALAVALLVLGVPMCPESCSTCGTHSTGPRAQMQVQSVRMTGTVAARAAAPVAQDPLKSSAGALPTPPDIPSSTLGTLPLRI